eukprot:14895195-Ditylum_brightwellii.AAC.1
MSNKCECKPAGDHKHKLSLQSNKYMNSPTDLAAPFFSSGTIEEWLKFCQNLSRVIKGQNVNNIQGMYAITKYLLQGDMLTACESIEGINRP